MKNRYCAFLLFAVLFPVTVFSQTLSLSWLRTDNHGLYNFGNYMEPFYFDRSNNDIISFVEVGMDTNNSMHGAAILRRSQTGLLIDDTLLFDSSYYNYQVKGFMGTGGETYYCFDHQHSRLYFEKRDLAGQLAWSVNVPRTAYLRAHDWPAKSMSCLLEDTVNNRMLWPFERFDPTYTSKTIGIFETNKTTGALTVIDSIYYPSIQNGNPFVYEIVRDAADHIYLSSTDVNGRALISLLNNGQLTTVALLDSTGFVSEPQSIRISQNTMFVAWQIAIPNNDFVNKVNVYNIATNGSLTLIRSMNFQLASDYFIGIKTFNTATYVFTSLRQDWTNTNFVPRIWKFDNGGNLLNLFTLPSYTGKTITDLSITIFGIYCSMFSYPLSSSELECIHPVTGQHISYYNMVNEFSGVNEGAYHVEAWTNSFNRDEVIASGSSWVNGDLRSNMAKYEHLMPEGINETAAPLFSVFADPAQNMLFITAINNDENFAAEIYDMTGRVVETKMLNGTDKSISLSALAKGVYTIRLYNQHSSSVQRFVKN